MKTYKCKCDVCECELKCSHDVMYPCECPMGLENDAREDISVWERCDPLPLSDADRIRMMASAHIMESVAFATAYDGEDLVGGAVTELESVLKTQCTDRDVFYKVNDIFDALGSVRTRFPDWESNGDCLAFISIIEGECEDIVRMAKSPGSGLEDLAGHFGV